MPSIAENVAAHIRDSILKNQLAPGTRLREQTLCEQLGVSRTPVREAFRILQSEGFLTHHTNSGVVVNRLNTAEIPKILEIRLSLEIISARHAARNATAAEAEELVRMNDHLCEVGLTDGLEAARLDRTFHRMIAKIGRNQFLLEYLDIIYRKNTMMRNTIPFKKARMPHTHKQHGDLIAAIAAGDEALAARYADIHFSSSLSETIEKLRAYESAEQSAGK